MILGTGPSHIIRFLLKIVELGKSFGIYTDLFRNISQMDKVWPQHQQRLEMALLEEAEVARKISSDALNALQRKRNIFFDSPYFVKRGSLTGMTTPKVPSRRFTFLYLVFLTLSVLSTICLA